MNACSILPEPISAPESILPPEPAEALTASPLPQLRKLIVTTTEHEVVITGRVATYYLKQLAQETLRPTLGDRRLLNHVEVRPS